MSREQQGRILLSGNIFLRYTFISRKRKVRRSQVNAIYYDRLKFGEFHHLYFKLRDDPRLFVQYTRMQVETFDYILRHIEQDCYHITTNFKKPISPEERLLLTLRYLATGLAFRQLEFSFRISKTAVSTIVIEVCMAIWKTLQNIHIKFPNESDFDNIASEFYKKWSFPHCLGCIDGKHIRIKCPGSSGSMYYNYKQFYSIVLMAVSDANYKFIMIDVGAYGKDSDGGVFSNTEFHRRLENGLLILPPITQLPNSTIEAPYVFLGDEAFPLRSYLLRPFPRRQLQDNNKSLFNYKLSSARMVVECSFGLMASKFRILQKAIETNEKNAVHIVQATCLLHNLIIDLEKDYGNMNDQHFFPQATLASRTANRASRNAIDIRQKFVDYFVQHRQ